MKTSSDKRLEELKSLVHDYSFPEWRSELLLTRLDELLQWAISEFIKPDLTESEVRHILGEPYIAVGEPAQSWLYPCLSSKNSESKNKAETDWFMQLNFIEGKLTSVQKRQWHFSKE